MRKICAVAAMTSTERSRKRRARLAAGLQPVEGEPLVDADDLLLPAVEETLTALKLADSDLAMAQVARSYARTIDQARDQAYALRHFGPLLLRALTELQATPMSRKDLPKKRAPRQPTQIEQLRAAHAQHPAVRRRNGA
jgi:hypothetical protein